MSSGYDPRHAGDPRHGNVPDPDPEPDEVNAGWVQPPSGMPDPASMPYSPVPYSPGWSGNPAQRYAEQPYLPAPYEPPSGDPSVYAPVPPDPAHYGTVPYFEAQPAPGAPAPPPYGNAPSTGPRYVPAPQSSPPSAPAPYAPMPYAQGPTSASPYSSPAYAPVAYVPASAATRYPADRRDRDTRRSVVTPFRVVIFIALVISASIAAYSLLVARGSQVIPVTVAALAVFAVSAALLGINLGAGAMDSARAGHLGRSILGALFGGILCLAAAGGASAAIVLGLLSRF